MKQMVGFIFLCGSLFAENVIQKKTRFQLGDDPAWAASGLDDSQWRTSLPGGGTHPQKNWWARIHVEAPVMEEVLIVQVYTMGSYTAFWNGTQIGQNGRPGLTEDDEDIGNHMATFVIPTEMVLQGGNTMALRISSWHSQVPMSYFRVEFGPASQIYTQRHQITGFYAAMFALLFAGGFLFLAFGYDRDVSLRWFGLLCLSVAFLLALEYGKYLVQYPYPWHFYRLIAITFLTMAVAILLFRYLVSQFHIKSTLIILMFPVFLIPFFIYDPDQHCYWIFVYGMAASIVPCIIARSRRLDGWLPITAVIGITLLVVIFSGARFADRWFFPSFLAMVALLAMRLIWESRREHEALVQEQLTSARLKVELMRKSIQPHFLKNSLAAAMAWFEEQPEKGTRLLGSLAEELDRFFQIGDRDLVDVREELALCQHHVETMRYVMDCDIKLTVEAPTSELWVPPGLIITCVENALTHGSFTKDQAIIDVYVVVGKDLLISVRNPADQKADIRVGTGSRYLAELLERHYPGKWTHDHRWMGGFWESSITIQTP